MEIKIENELYDLHKDIVNLLNKPNIGNSK